MKIRILASTNKEQIKQRKYAKIVLIYSYCDLWVNNYLSVKEITWI